MKKKYSLNYSIERDIDRLAAVKDILDTLDTTPNNAELEQMASYILYGKDENGQNAIQRKECTDSDKRYSTFKRTEDKNQSLDALLENPMSDQQDFQSFDKRSVYMKKVREIRRPKYDKKGNLIDIGDGDIPGLPELWERIDYLEKVIAANEGKIPLDPNTMSIIDNPYRLYQLKHQLIDMRRHQYYLRDSYKPTIYFLNIKPPQPQPINFDSDSFYWLSFAQWRRNLSKCRNPFISKNLRDYETKFINGKFKIKWVVRHQKFDWENQTHVKALLNNYSAIYMQDWDKLHSWGRALIYDFDRYVAMCDLSPVREYVLTRRIDKAKPTEISQEVQEKFGLRYNEDHLSSIVTKEIVKQITTSAKRHRLLIETPLSERKQCFRCKKWLPRNSLFFGINNSHKDGRASNCKECERKRRIERGGQTEYDQRFKDPTLHKMQTRKTNT